MDMTVEGDASFIAERNICHHPLENDGMDGGRGSVAVWDLCDEVSQVG
jgi:hypothetical protein